MKDSTEDKVQKDHYNAHEVGVLQALTLLGIIVLDNAHWGVVKNEDCILFKAQGVSQIEGIDKLKEIFMAISKNAPESEKGQKGIDRNVFKEERNKSLEEWDIRDNNMENPVGDYYLVDNYELGRSKASE